MAQVSTHIHDSSFSIVTAEVKNKWKTFLVLGVCMITLGMVTTIFSLSATFAMKIVIGAVLISTGIVQILHAFSIPIWNGFLFSLLNAILGLAVGGVLLLFSPIIDTLRLILFTAAFFTVSGLFRISLAVSVRPFDHWMRLMMSGFVSLAMAVLLLIVRPNASLWLLGLLMGLDLIFTGSTLTMLGFSGRQDA